MRDHLPYGSSVRPDKPASNLSEWTLSINSLSSNALCQSAAGISALGVAEKVNPYGPLSTVLQAGTAPVPASSRLLTKGLGGDSGAPFEAIDTAAPTPNGLASTHWRMAPEVAEHLVADGLDPDYLSHLATVSGLEPRDLFEFAGIDRTTVSRRKASGAALPHEAAVKALQATELVTQATEVFGAPTVASAWLNKTHPLLDGQTPLQRARTPWGMHKVQSMLVALRFGGVV